MAFPRLAHLIVGAGNMGKRHGRILAGYGDKVKYRDIGWKPQRKDFYGIDGILICTPPETHLRYYYLLAKYGLPIFVEKPIITSTTLSDINVHRPISTPTMVACNWRYCRCIRPLIGKAGWSMYPGARPLDLIHFYDLACHRQGRELDLKCIKFPANTWRCSITMGRDSAWGIFLADNPSQSLTRFGGRNLHNPFCCAMYYDQMSAWRRMIRGGEEINPIPLAIKRTARLIDALAS